MQIHTSRSVLLLVLSSTLATLAGCGSQPKPEATAATEPMVMKSPATKPIVEPVVLKFTDKSIKAIQAGTKTATIRKGARPLPATVRAVGNPGDMVMLDSVTTTTKKLSELTEADAKANGSVSLDELKTELLNDYPGLTADDTVTVISFKLWKA
jgi:uncharacterized protein YqfB (UPF0267 family)